MVYDSTSDSYCAILKPKKTGTHIVSEIYAIDAYDNGSGYYSKEITDTLAVHLQSNKKNNLNKHSKSRSLKKIDQNFSGYKFKRSNNSVGKKYSKDLKYNKNFIYEHSALNILGIHKKFKIW